MIYSLLLNPNTEGLTVFAKNTFLDRSLLNHLGGLLALGLSFELWTHCEIGTIRECNHNPNYSVHCLLLIS